MSISCANSLASCLLEFVYTKIWKKNHRDSKAPKVKKVQRNLIDREALMAKKNSNKQEAKELAQLIDNLKNSSSKIEPKLNQMRVRQAELEKELESVKATIECHESNLTQIPNAIK